MNLLAGIFWWMHRCCLPNQSSLHQQDWTVHTEVRIRIDSWQILSKNCFARHSFPFSLFCPVRLIFFFLFCQTLEKSYSLVLPDTTFFFVRLWRNCFSKCLCFVHTRAIFFNIYFVRHNYFLLSCQTLKNVYPKRLIFFALWDNEQLFINLSDKRKVSTFWLTLHNCQVQQRGHVQRGGQKLHLCLAFRPLQPLLHLHIHHPSHLPSRPPQVGKLKGRKKTRTLYWLKK